MNNINKFISAITAFIGLFTFSCCISSFGNIAAEEEATPKIERHFVFEVIPMNLQEIKKLSGKIFAGNCIKAENIENDPESRLPVVQYTFKITDGIKGTGDKKEITFKQWQPTIRNSGYEVGKKYVLFLHPESEKGLTSTVGLDQGLFEVKKKGIIRQKEVVKNKLSNKGLSRNLRTQKRIEIKNNKYIDDYIDSCSENGAAIRYKEFVEAVKSLKEEE